MNPSHLIDAANDLLRAKSGRPRQSNLRRAISTAYYAMFHALCGNSADCLIGTAGADRSKPAWRQVYRSVTHGFAKSQCENKKIIGLFPEEIQAFATNFVKLQEKRHEADYDPASKYMLNDVELCLETAKLDIARMGEVSIKDRRAFAAWVTVKDRQ